VPLEHGPAHAALKSAHARYAAYAAASLGYSFRSLDGEDGYLFEVRDAARCAVFAAGAGSPYALNDARAASIARDKAFSAEVLRRAGLPVLPGEMFFVTRRWADMRSPGREPEDALAYARAAQYPLFCKPISASNGLYAEVIESADAFAAYTARVSREHFAILIQPYVRAEEHRVFVLEGRALFSYRKSKPHVTGDGASTLGALIAAMPMPRDPHEPVRNLHGRAPSGERISLEDTPACNQRIVLEGPANRAAGGGANAVRDGAPQAMADLAIRASEALGLKLAAVDMFDRASEGGDLVVIEVNSNPMIATLEDHGRWDLIAEIWSANFAAALR
jgi:glutathione synthase/RimK-type ligase-like ATP-grasp enzyme